MRKLHTKKVKWYILGVFSCILLLGSFGFTQVDLAIESVDYPASVPQGASPQIDITVENIGATDADNEGTIIDPGFIYCEWLSALGNQPIFSSDRLTTLRIEANTFQRIQGLQLSNEITQSPGDKEVTCTIDGQTNFFTDANPANNSQTFTFSVIERQGGRFDTALERSIEPIQRNLDAAEPGQGTQAIKNFIFTMFTNVVFPLAIVVGLIIAITGFYKMMFKADEDAAKEGTRHVIRGVVAIIILMSARYLATTLFQDIFAGGNMIALSGVDIAANIYDKIAFPFIKIAIYIVLGILFIIIVSRVFTFFTSASDDAKKKAGTLIARNIIGMFIILGAKQIVEAVYGTREQVINENAQNLGDIGSGILENNNIPLIYNIINRVLGLAAFIILVIIIFQAYQLLINPDNADQMKKIKHSIIYIFIGILVIGAGYLITNFLIIN